MKVSGIRLRQSGFTLAELLVVILIVFVSVALLVPYSGPSRRAKVPRCMNNQKQIEIGFIMYSSDHGDFRRQISPTNSDAGEFSYSGHASTYFQKLKEYKIPPDCFICPFETDRKAATNYDSLNDLHLSYFVNGDNPTNSPANTISTGDRFLQLNHQPVAHGLLVVDRNLDFEWPPKFHVNGAGCLGFADAHVESMHSDRLSAIIRTQPLATNHFSIP